MYLRYIMESRRLAKGNLTSCSLLFSHKYAQLPEIFYARLVDKTEDTFSQIIDPRCSDVIQSRSNDQRITAF